MARTVDQSCGRKRQDQRCPKHQRNGDKELLQQCLGRLEKFHEWFWRERDVTNIGLIAVGSYSGIVQHAKWETFDYDCAMDGLKLTPHPTRKGPNEGAWYGDICMAGNTAYLILGERSLALLTATAYQRPDEHGAKFRKRHGLAQLMETKGKTVHHVQVREPIGV